MLRLLSLLCLGVGLVQTNGNGSTLEPKFCVRDSIHRTGSVSYEACGITVMLDQLNSKVDGLEQEIDAKVEELGQEIERSRAEESVFVALVVLADHHHHKTFLWTATDVWNNYDGLVETTIKFFAGEKVSHPSFHHHHHKTFLWTATDVW